MLSCSEPKKNYLTKLKFNDTNIFLKLLPPINYITVTKADCLLKLVQCATITTINYYLKNVSM